MRTKLLLSTLLAASLLLLSTTVIQAQGTLSTTDIPRTISYQGILTNTDGAEITDGNYTISLSLYADPTGTVKVWHDTYNVPIINGIFNIFLGAGNKPLPDASAMNTPLWIGTQVGDSPEMYPLTPLSASPYALNVSDKAITTGKLADGAVTAEKVKMDYISGVEVNDRKVAGVGTVLKLKSSNDITLDYDETTNSITIASSNEAQRGTTGDPEKGGTVLDNTDPNRNWLGRNVGVSQPFFDAAIGFYNTLAGGFVNNVGANCDYNTIAGGGDNSITDDNDLTFIGGGNLNVGDNSFGVIGGGHSNLVSGYGGTIGGGWDNAATGDYSFMGGGQENIVDGDWSTIGGGLTNIIDPNAWYSFIGGGQENFIDAYSHWSTIAGGKENQITEALASIGGGGFNHVSGYAGTIGGGETNSSTGNYATIGGGSNNHATGALATVAGGYNNMASGNYSAVGGGSENVAAAPYSTIPGGDHLETTGYGQTAVGFYNASRGTMPGRPLILTDDPLFMVGNGPAPFLVPPPSRSNAFEVSYNGHSVVYDVNGAVRIPFRGATYVDNVIDAWGDINGNGTINAQFGVAAVTHPFAGTYIVRIALNDPQTGAPVTLTGASITATVAHEGIDPGLCYTITASRIGNPGANQFEVRIKTINCVYTDAPFMFKVTGRP